MSADAIGGVWSYCLSLARSAPWEDITLCLATMGTALSRSQAEEAAALPNVEIVERPCKLEWMDDPWDDVEAAGAWLLQLEEEFSPDVIHLNGYAHGALPFLAPKIIVGHSCVLSWWQAVKGHPAPPRWEEYRRAVQRGLDAADAIVAPSRAMLNELNSLYGPFENGSVIYNGCEPNDFRRANKEPFILAAGRAWDEAKNIGALAAVADTIRWPIYVAGDSKGPQSRIDNEDWKSLNFLGKLSRASLAEWFSRAAIYALPARYEPFGLSILEAALSGCALVLGDIPSLREIWGGAALFVPPNDSEGLKIALQKLIHNPRELAAFSARAEARALQFSIERTSEAYLELYQLIVSQKQNTRGLLSCA